MKYYLLLILLLGSVDSFSQNRTVTTYNYSRTNNIVTIRDSEYFKRLDEIEKQKYLVEYEKLEKAYDYLEKGDYESALFWAKKTQYYKYGLDCEVYLIFSISHVKLNSPYNEWKNWYKRLKKICEPEKIRYVESFYNSIGHQYK